MAREIDWDKAPEGTTHAFAPDFWRKVTKDAVYEWSRLHQRWDLRPEAPALWIVQQVGMDDFHAQERPKPVENPLPNGLPWFEDATHWNPNGKAGFFFNEERFYWDGEWRAWGGMHDYWEFHKDTIKRFPEGVKAQVVKQEPKPEPKKPVGWWT